jgi:hypothetical protein
VHRIALAALAFLTVVQAPTPDTDATRAWLRGPVRVVTTAIVRERGAKEKYSRETYDPSGALVELVEYLRGEPIATTTFTSPNALRRDESVVRSRGPQRTRLRPLKAVAPEIVTTPGGAELYVATRVFNSAGHIATETRYVGNTPEATRPLSKRQYRYDRAGRLAEIIFMEGPMLRQSGRVVYGYRPDDVDPYESVRYGPSFQNPQKSSYDYTRDGVGNWTVRRETQMIDGKPVVETLERTISYHTP